MEVPALLDSGSEVTLITEGYFNGNIKSSLGAASDDKAEGHTIFQLRGVSENEVPLKGYFEADLLVGKEKIPEVGILIKKDGDLVDSSGKSTRAPAIFGCNALKLALKDFIDRFGEDTILLFECPHQYDALLFCAVATYFFGLRDKAKDQKAETGKGGLPANSAGVGVSVPSGDSKDTENWVGRPTTNPPKPPVNGVVICSDE